MGYTQVKGNQAASRQSPKYPGSFGHFSFPHPGHCQPTVLFSMPQLEQETSTGDLYSPSSFFNKTGKLA